MAAVHLASDERLEGRRVVVKHPLREADRLIAGLPDEELLPRPGVGLDSRLGDDPPWRWLSMSKKATSPAAPEGARRATGGAAGDVAADRGRFSSRRKAEAVLRLLRGEALDAVSRELGVSGATLGQWREQFLAAGQASLKAREADARDEEIQRLRAKVGEITMANELLLERAHAREAGLPLAPRRSRP